MYDHTLDGQPQVTLQSHTESSADSMDLRNFEDVLGTAHCHRKPQMNNLLLTANKRLLRIEGTLSRPYFFCLPYVPANVLRNIANDNVFDLCL